jgi:ADP-ribose pyrophosphatase
MRLVTVKIQLTESDPEPQANLDEGEHIVKRIVPLKELYGVLKGAFRSYGTGEDGLLIEVCAERIDYDKKGYTVDARLAHFALGWRMGFESKDD